MVVSKLTLGASGTNGTRGVARIFWSNNSETVNIERVEL